MGPLREIQVLPAVDAKASTYRDGIILNGPWPTTGVVTVGEPWSVLPSYRLLDSFGFPVMGKKVAFCCPIRAVPGSETADGRRRRVFWAPNFVCGMALQRVNLYPATGSLCAAVPVRVLTHLWPTCLPLTLIL